MKKVFINENLNGNELNELLLFVGRKSNKLSLSRSHLGKLTQEEFNQMQLEDKSLILAEHKQSRLDYNENINGYRDLIDDYCDTKMDAEEYLNHHFEEELAYFTSLGYEAFQLEGEEFQDEKYEDFNARTADFLYTKFTRVTPVSRGPAFEMCYFILGDIFRKLMSNMSKLFVYPHQIEGTEFDDLTFYKEERTILAICAHEHFAYMNLENDEYEELKRLNILVVNIL
ncbi:hypothetical protein [Clostridium estertheticum]|uniref:hypothetical protein n=1 Tax=Clostridium estertheticum TaxID=238834 RepID=UPI001CF4EBA4|nr:hypothetical protein [Clostridium estertheticum]MCB2358747.1 hypothetical protein [Clostridium estertheticum]